MKKERSIIKDVTEFLTNHQGEKYSSVQISELTGLTRKQVGNCLCRLMKLSGHDIKQKRTVSGIVYWSTGKKNNEPQSNNDIVPVPELIISQDSNTELPFNLTLMVNSMSNMQRENQMFRQGLGQIASILLQMGVIHEK